MTNDSIKTYYTLQPDTIYVDKQFIKSEKLTTPIISIWTIGLILVLFVIKRPNK